MIAGQLRAIVFEANRALAQTGLVMGTFGNVSQADHAAGVFVIKPSGMAYDAMTPADMVPVSIETGKVVDSERRPSSDTPTHLELYRAFTCGGIVHTHSEYATVFAQARVPIRCMGTTHADYFRADIPVTRPLTREEVEREYERNTGLVIVETLRREGLSCDEMSAVLVANHGPFTWGRSAMAAIEHAEVLEFLARVEWRVRALAADVPRPDAFLVEKHHSRKHGPHAYYGQKEP